MSKMRKRYTKAQTYSVIFDYIDGWYNTKRIDSTLGRRSPVENFKQLQNKEILEQTGV